MNADFSDFISQPFIQAWLIAIAIVVIVVVAIAVAYYRYKKRP